MGPSAYVVAPGGWFEVDEAQRIMTSPKQLGKYQIEARVGEGGMGVVYRAFDPDLSVTLIIFSSMAPSCTCFP